MSHILLVGFMGAGKSTVAAHVAHELGLDLIDLDRLIEESRGMSIADIFAREGEPAFRDLETRALRSLALRSPAVVATGGGIVTRDVNQRSLKALGVVVLLEVDAATALERVGSGADRPLLNGSDAEQVAALLAGREDLYRSVADIVCDTRGRAVRDVSQDVVSALRFGWPQGAAVRSAVRAAVPGAEYHVSCLRGFLGALGDAVSQAVRTRRAALVTDSTVNGLYGEAARVGLMRAGLSVCDIEVPAGESSKTWESAGVVIDALADARLERGDVIIALGGGVVGDLAGFCAAVYLRGIDVIHVPTTLLAQVDSSIGGKTGVDLVAGKNLAGAFKQPRAVFADPALLCSLPESEWISGLGEVVKTALLEGGDLLDLVSNQAAGLREREESAVDDAVALCQLHKVSVVAADERESGLRESLNLGHTLGHAIEKVVGYGVIPHGTAVAEGIRFASMVATRTGVADAGFEAFQRDLLGMLGFAPLRLEVSVDDVLDAMRSDKKVREGGVRMVLLREAGIFTVETIAEQDLRVFLTAWKDSMEG